MRIGFHAAVVALVAREFLLGAAFRAAVARPYGRRTTGLAMAETEVEKKFPIPPAGVKSQLSSFGFEESKRVEFVDYYFDLPAPHWHFSLIDCWIRYREQKVMIGNNYGWRGMWQVKIGDSVNVDSDRMTVYKEVQGDEAKEFILNTLAKLDDKLKDDALSAAGANERESECDAPQLKGAEVLVPFARFKTFRTCYTPAREGSQFSTLRVDVDKTDFGYSIGEVEEIISAEASLLEQSQSKARVREFVDRIIPTDGESQATLSCSKGKLEYYLEHNSPEHYRACLRAGVMINSVGLKM